MKTKNIEELNRLYDAAKSADKEAVAEMRSNILLIAGDHFSKRMTESGSFRQRGNGADKTDSSYKLRITKNWLSRAQRIYVNSILSQSPGVGISARNQTELQDQKAAELTQSVWEYAKSKYKLKPLIRYLCADFTGTGEVALKIFFDPMKGELKGYEQAIDENGTPLVDEMGQPVPDDDMPVFTGEFVFERIYAHMLFRDPTCQTMGEAEWLGVEKLQSSSVLKARYKDDKDKLKYIDESNEEFVIFDSARSGYSREKDQTCVREVYYKPCHEYPKGYFYVTTKSGVLEEGELPEGKFPILWKGFDESPTKARASSFVKTARPWQAEINRASSQAALHSITLGEDKLLYQAGTKVTQGALLPGIRGLAYQGAPPTVLQGRTGEQFFPYIAMQEQEMNRALLLDFLNQDKNSNLDPFSMLFRSAEQAQAFSLYSTKFGEFLVEVCELFLCLARYYLEGDELIAAVGRAEAINIAEFKTTSPLNYSIQVDEQNDSMETKLGKQLTLNHILQYVGTNMSKEDIGKLIEQMPFGNWKEGFSDYTLDSKNVKNDFLAMERGEQPMVSENDDSKYSLKQVAKRKKERDFRLLPPQIQQLYMMYEQYHQGKMAKEAQALKAAESEFIPASGAMIACDMYVAAGDPNKAPKRVRVPYQALEWLVQTLEKQGMGMEAMEQMNQAQVAQVTQALLGQQGAPQQNQGQASPMGV